jgi:CubicO group peptidase (beta-lactamase class C family)
MGLNIVAWNGRSLSDHQQQVNTWSAKGYRTKSLCVYGDPSAPLYAAVMILRPVVIPERSWYSLTPAQFQQIFDQQAGQGFGPYIVSATGPADDPLIAASFCPVTPTPLTRTSISASELEDLNAVAFQDNLMLRWADAYGSPDNVRYIAVWWPNPVQNGTTAQTAWQNDGLADDAATAQARFEAATSGRARPVHIALDPAYRILEVYADTEIGPWVSRAGLTGDQYQAEFDTQHKAGLSPVCVAASGSGEGVRYAAIFAGSEEPTPRKFRSSSPSGSPAVSTIDDLIESYMKTFDLRGMSLAILDGARLVYAKGYTWAEPDYPDITPTTYFRQASVSKTFTALAIYQLIEDGVKCADGSTFSLDTRLQTVLKLTSPGGGPPTDMRFKDITIRHLLEMTSGVADVWGQDIAAAGGAGHLPASAHTLAQYSAGQMLTNQPGDTTQVRYNNTGYTMLGLVITSLRGAPDLISAVTPKLLHPLGITRVRSARSLVTAQQPGEAIYHPRKWAGNVTNTTTQLVSGHSLMTPDQPLVPYMYGYLNVENITGSGGISAAATDVARLIATFNVAGDSPILKAATRTTMLQNAAYATAHYKGPAAHGYHGFDSASEWDPAHHYYYALKGGELFTSENAYWFWMGGFSYVVCKNGTTPKDSGTWVNTMRAAAEAHSWGNVNLFPAYGMSPL